MAEIFGMKSCFRIIEKAANSYDIILRVRKDTER